MPETPDLIIEPEKSAKDIKEEALKLAAQKQAEIDQLHKQLEAAMAGDSDVDAQAELSKAFDDVGEKESRIAELEEKLKQAGAMESILGSSLRYKGLDIEEAARRITKLRADSDDEEDGDDDLPPASMPSPIHPTTPPSLSAENDEPSEDEDA